MDEHFYGVGRIRTLEAKMISPAQLARMAAAPDFKSAFAVLSETLYTENLPKLKHPFDFEELCELELIALKHLITYLAPENEILSALFRKYDYLNIKILLKSLFSQSKKIDLYLKAGTIDFEKLKLYIFEEIKEIDDEEIIEAIDSAKKAYEQIKDPQSLDILVDKYYFSYLKKVINTSPSLLIMNMVNYQIDLINIKILLRMQELKKDKKTLQNSLLESGFIDKDILLNLYDKSIQDITSKLSFTPYLPAIAEGFEYLAKNRSFYLLEKLMEDFIIDQFRKAKYLSSGIEPLVGFYLAKEAEIKTLRFILICKKNHIDSGRIKERLTASYV